MRSVVFTFLKTITIISIVHC